MKEHLTKKLRKVEHFFDVKKVAATPIDRAYVTKYYQINKQAYSWFHSRKPLVHMGISKNGVYDEEDLYAQARKINVVIRDQRAEQVLELAAGRGGNSAWLAMQNKEVVFTGIDISTTQLSFARKLAQGLENFHVKQAGFEDLGQFKDASFDLIFVIEALCYRTNLDQSLREIYRVLKPGGHLIVYDGYRTKEAGDLESDELLMVELLEIGMAVNEFDTYHQFVEKASKIRLDVVENEDLSEEILPTVRRFEQKAKIFFKLQIFAKVLLRVLPTKFSYNIISGYLFPTLIEEKLFSYHYTLLQKRELGNF
jgi:ubiquinone/menaquinone biosynthesis C-methylase UbiE